MSPEELQALARRLPDELLTQGDLTIAADVVTPDCVHHTPIPVPPGPAGLIGWVVALRRAFPDLYALVEDEVVEGNTVTQRLALSGTHRGEFLGLPPTRRRIRWRLIAIQRAGPDARCAEHWSSWDQQGLLRQLGALPAIATWREVGEATREEA